MADFKAPQLPDDLDPGALADGDVPAYDTVTKRFVPQQVIPATATDGQVLTWDASAGEWVARSGTSETTITEPLFTITEPGDYIAGMLTTVTLPTGATLSLTIGQFIVVRRYDREWFFKIASLDSAGTGPATVVTPLGPVWTDNTATGGGTWSTPTQEGVTYTPSGVDQAAAANETLTWTATPDPGYAFPAEADATWTHTFAGVPVGPIGAAYLGGGYSPSTEVTRTFTGMNLGDPDPNRVILVAVSINGQSNRLSTVTIGGVAANVVLQGGGFNNTVALASAVVPSGTTGDVVVTFSSSHGPTILQMTRLINVSTVPYLIEKSGTETLATVPALPAGSLAVVAVNSIGVPGPLDASKPTNWSLGDPVSPLGPPVGDGLTNERALFFGTFTTDGSPRSVDGRYVKPDNNLSRAGAISYAVYNPRTS